MKLTPEVIRKLFPPKPYTKMASASFQCTAFGSDWDDFVARWASKIYPFLLDALGPFGQEPNRVIEVISDGNYIAGVNASYMPGSGKIKLSKMVEGNPGVTLEKLCHEMTHANLERFPEGDPFYEEGFVDYSVWLMAHAPIWGEYRQAMIQSAASNLKTRRTRAELDQTDYDRKRWAGSLFAATVRGPWILANLKMKKLEGDYTW